MSLENPEMYDLQMHHAHQICGIVAHVKDRGVASVAIRTLVIAAECLTDFREQSEILTILQKIKKETGWRIDFIQPELRQKWQWTDDYVREQQQKLRMQESFAGLMRSPPTDYWHYQPEPPRQTSPPVPTQPPLTNSLPAPVPPPSAPQPQQHQQQQQPQPQQQSNGGAPSAHTRIPSGIVNPLMRTADFTAPQHPYMNVYVPPVQPHNDAHYMYRAVDNHWH